MLELPPKIVVFDTEFTSWEGAMARGWSGPGEYREIVQIGAVRAETQNFSELDALTLYVKPVKNPQLSSYFIDLTGITQEEVNERGTTLAEALENFQAWAGGRPFYSWGRDMDVVRENAALIGIGLPSGLQNDFDIRDLFRAHGVAVEQYISSTIPRAFGEEPPAHAHDALNDARSILQGLRALAHSQSAVA